MIETANHCFTIKLKHKHEGALVGFISPCFSHIRIEHCAALSWIQTGPGRVCVVLCWRVVWCVWCGEKKLAGERG